MKSSISLILLAALSVASVIPQAAAEEKPAATQATAKPPLIPAATFVDPGRIRLPKISPDGEKLLFREMRDKKVYLTITNVSGTGGTKRVAVPEKHSLNWYRWAGNDQILFSMTGIGNVLGEQVPLTGLMLYQPSTNTAKAVGLKTQGIDGDDVLYVEPDGRYILLAMQKSIYDYPGVYHVTLADNKSVEIVKPQSDIFDWVADDQGVVRMGLAYLPSSLKIYYRSKKDDKFALISKIREKDDEETKQNGLLEINRIVSGKDEGYVLSNKETGRFAVYKFNYLTREIGEKVFGHDKNDVTDFSLNDEGTAIEAVTYTDDRDRIVWFDEVYKKQQRMLDKALPGQEAWMQSHSKQSGRMIVFSTSPTDPGSYFLYDSNAKTMNRIAGINDLLDPDQLAVTKYVHYPARDGLSVPAYLTLPVGRPSKALPLIILPHGGPFGVRDTLDYNSEVQFLANRGYAVLQPNYRGSESYGEEFYKKGEGQIGRTMQDDLDDGMDWLVKDGVVDAGRVCIVGSSYGGYAALWGVIRNPERYRCAASFAGVTDFKSQIRYDARSLKSRYAREWRSKVQGDEKFDLDLVSPAKNIAKLNRPVLLTHGDDDTNVPYSQYKSMMAAAKKAGKVIDGHVYEGEGHGFDDPANEKNWLERLEAFLAKHNPAEANAAASDAKPAETAAGS